VAFLSLAPQPSAAQAATRSAQPQPVILQFIGNSCTLITAPDGTRIVSDPYGDDSHPAGLRRLPGDLRATAVTVSHAHPDHNNVSAVGGAPQIITGPGTVRIGMVGVTGYGGYEGSPSGPSHNTHTVFVFEIDGVKIVHLGDSGPVTAPDALAAIENADVVLVNIDGYVFPLDRVLPWMRQIGARTIIPTHYSLRPDARWGTAETLTIDEYLGTLPSSMTVVRMDSEIPLAPGMPRQVAALTPLMLER
jgi:L-ascorbate metabolism protein UlaG (beta-lactamase superfamily)